MEIIIQTNILTSINAQLVKKQIEKLLKEDYKQNNPLIKIYPALKTIITIDLPVNVDFNKKVDEIIMNVLNKGKVKNK